MLSRQHFSIIFIGKANGGESTWVWRENLNSIEFVGSVFYGEGISFLKFCAFNTLKS